jgi:hypothetical protein
MPEVSEEDRMITIIHYISKNNTEQTKSLIKDLYKNKSNPKDRTFKGILITFFRVEFTSLCSIYGER